MPRNIRKACCAAFSLALGSGPSSVAAQIDADRPGPPAETREDRRYGKQLEAPSPLLFPLPRTGQAAPPQRLTYQYSYAGEAEATYRRDPDTDPRRPGPRPPVAAHPGPRGVARPAEPLC